MNAPSRLDLPMLENEANAFTFREYFTILLEEVYTKEDAFSGLHPFGSVGWKNELYESLIYNEIVDPNVFNSVNGFTAEQVAELDRKVLELIKEL